MSQSSRIALKKLEKKDTLKIRFRHEDTPFLRAAFPVIVGGVRVLLIGSA